MIYINRSQIAPPRQLLEKGESEAAQARGFFMDPNIESSGRRFRYEAYRSSDVRAALMELFNQKCAFCEKKFDANELVEIEHFRPLFSAVNYDGSITSRGYWWLGWEWSNLYPACSMCRRTKAKRFQVVGRRAEFLETGALEKTFNLPHATPAAIAVTENMQFLILLDSEGYLHILDLEADEVIQSWSLAGKPPFRLDTAANGKVLAILSADGIMHIRRFTGLFDQQNAQILFENPNEIRDMALSGDGSTLAIAFPTAIEIWDLSTGKLKDRSGTITTSFTALDLSADGRTLVIVGADGQLAHFDVSKGDKSGAQFVESDLVVAVMAPDAESAVALSSDGDLHLLDLRSYQERFSIAQPGFGRKLRLTADGRFAATLGTDRVSVVDLYKRQQILVIDNHGVGINDLALTPGGRAVFTVDQNGDVKTWALDSVGDERALLIDPCQTDPARYLIFDDSGLVVNVPPYSDSLKAVDGSRYENFDRGQTTIDTFGLNRIELVKARQTTAEMLREEVEQGARLIAQKPNSSQNDLFLWFEDLSNRAHPFAAMRRQLLPQYLAQVPDSVIPGLAAAYSNFISQRIGRQPLAADVEDAYSAFAAHEKEKEQTDIEEGEGNLLARSALISRIEIKNFRCIEELAFNFSGGQEERVGWKVLLGENGVGKSSVLEAVALAVMGGNRLQQLVEESAAEAGAEKPVTPPDVDLKSVLRRGAQDGSIRVHFSTVTEPVELRLTPDGPDLATVTNLKPFVYLLGFGSARWLPRPGSRPPETDTYVRVRNLFNPFVPLTDGIQWLIDLKKEEIAKAAAQKVADPEENVAVPQKSKYEEVEEVLTRLLQLEPGTTFPLHEGTIKVQKPKKAIADADRLDQLSDGYQTVLAIAVAIMDMLGEEFQMKMELAESLVLLDEIGAHLHPRWKLLIVDSLRSAFPRMQFLAATHEPLCLRGLYDNEILVLSKNDDDQLVVKDNVSSIDALSIDELLVSPVFGLLTTFVADTEKDFEEYYNILSLPEAMRDQVQLEQLRQRLRKYGKLGEMARRQIASRLMEQRLLALEALSEETRNIVAIMWDDILQGEDGQS